METNEMNVKNIKTFFLFFYSLLSIFSIFLLPLTLFKKTKGDLYVLKLENELTRVEMKAIKKIVDSYFYMDRIDTKDLLFVEPKGNVESVLKELSKYGIIKLISDLKSVNV
jgi:hypothetical protein